MLLKKILVPVFWLQMTSIRWGRVSDLSALNQRVYSTCLEFADADRGFDREFVKGVEVIGKYDQRHPPPRSPPPWKTDSHP